ncbi:MAG: hypothetical protein FWG88_08760 [Oscillospiraceae bacterium]|nr:hypothetical protein [Oscillospiraceae bacterium]
MEYQVLYDEYVKLLHIKMECRYSLNLLKKGYISTKRISGKKYPYLQYRVDGKLVSEYIKEGCLSDVRVELEKRKTLDNEIGEIDERLAKIESAAEILDKNLHRKLVLLRRCDAMGAMSIEEKEKSLAFSRAIVSLEGTSASEETEHNLSRWVAGNLSFMESLQYTLRIYHLTEV